jgi:hypothetical protein
MGLRGQNVNPNTIIQCQVEEYREYGAAFNKNNNNNNNNSGSFILYLLTKPYIALRMESK